MTPEADMPIPEEVMVILEETMVLPYYHRDKLYRHDLQLADKHLRLRHEG